MSVLVSVSWGCLNQAPQTGQLKQQEVIVSVLGARVSNQDVGGSVPSKDLEEESLPGLSPSFWWPRAFLGL